MRVIVLSRDYLPLSYCDIRRAMCLVYLKKAEIIRETGAFWHSVNERFAVPKVIRLLNKIAYRCAPKMAYSRKNVLRRDKSTCQYCGAKEELTLDHVFPKSRGGPSSWTNVVVACRSCNVRKGARTPEEANMPLKKPPAQPHHFIQVDWGAIWGEA